MLVDNFDISVNSKINCWEQFFFFFDNKLLGAIELEQKPLFHPPQERRREKETEKKGARNFNIVITN